MTWNDAVQTGEVTTGIDLTNCISYFDGCNTCSVVSGEVFMCTLMACGKISEPVCLEYIVTGGVDEMMTGYDGEEGFVSMDDSNIALITMYYVYLQNHKFQQAHDMITGTTSSVNRLNTLYGNVTRINTYDFKVMGEWVYKGMVDIEESTGVNSLRKYTYQVAKQIVDGKIKHVSSVIISDSVIATDNNTNAPSTSTTSAPREGKTQTNLPDLTITSVELTQSAIIENGGTKLNMPQFMINVKNIWKGSLIPKVTETSPNKWYTAFSIQCRTPVDIKNGPNRWAAQTYRFQSTDEYKINLFPLKPGDTIPMYWVVLSRDIPYIDAGWMRYDIPFGWEKPGPQEVICKVNSNHFNDYNNRDELQKFNTTESNYTNNEYKLTIDVKEAK